MLTGHLKGQGVGFEALNDIMEQQQQEQANQAALESIMRKTTPTSTIKTGETKRQAQSQTDLLDEYGKYFEPNSVEFRPLPSKNGLTITETESLCFPTSNWIFASRFSPYDAMKDYIEGIDQIEDMYGSLWYESLDGATKAPPTPTTESKVKTITDREEGENKFLMLKLFRKIKFRYMKIKPLIKALAKEFKTQIPYLTIATLKHFFPMLGSLPATVEINALKRLVKIKDNQKYYSKGFVEDADVMGVIGDLPDGITPDNETRRKATTNQFINLGQNNLQNIAMFERIINAFMQNQVDPSFYDNIESVRTAIQNIVDGHNGNLLETTDQILGRLFETKTTYLAKQNGTDEGPEGELGNTTYAVYTILPILQKQGYYRTYTIEMMPFTENDQTFRYENKFKTVMQDTKGRLYENILTDYSCIEPRVTEICRICYVTRYPKLINDKCLTDLISGNSKENETCTKKEVKQTQDFTTRIGRREWAYSTNKPSSLITVCNKEIKEREIPKQGIVKIPDSSICSFQFKNGPFTGFKPFAPGVDIQTEIVEYKDESKLQKKMMEIKDHFQEYMYVYIPVILSIIGLLLTTLLVMICCFQQTRTRLNTPKLPKRVRFRNERANIETTQPTRRIEIGFTSPFRPGWEIQDV
jgi:hypothetical protein